MEEVFEIRSCIEITSRATQMIRICSTVNKELQGKIISDIAYILIHMEPT